MGMTHLDATKMPKGELSEGITTQQEPQVTPEPRLTGPHDPDEHQPWVVQFRVPRHLETLVRNKSTEGGESLNTVMITHLEMGFAPPVDVNPAQSLEAAAYAFLETLDPDHKRVLLDNVEEHHRSLSEYVISALKRVYDQGDASYLMPDAALPAEVAPARAEGELICEDCEKAIARPYIRRGQRYCHDPEPALIKAVEDASLRFGLESKEFTLAQEALEHCPDPCGRAIEAKRVVIQRAAHVQHLQSSEHAEDMRKFLPKRRK